MEHKRTLSATILLVGGLVLAAGAVLAGNPIAHAHGEVRQLQLFVALAAGVLGILCSVSGFRLISPFILLIPAYAILQCIPLPLGLVEVLSPSRAALYGPAARGWATFSVRPSETVYHSLWILACVILLIAAYNLGERFHERRWVVTIPLFVIATFEAVLGLLQAVGHPGTIATGTYEIRNHFAGLLEMVLPLGCAYPIAALRNGQRRYISAALSVCAAAVIVAGILVSQSRMGLFAAIASTLVIGLGAVRKRGGRLSITLGVSIVAGFALLLPIGLLSHLADLDNTGEGRVEVWRQSLPLIAAYPVFGCGLGGYESAFTEFKRSNPLFNQDYAHNDYLQYLAELGALGFAVFVTPVVIIIRGLIRSLSNELALACFASLVAIGLHSFVDFNLYVPANMLVFSWILGISAGAGQAAQG